MSFRNRFAQLETLDPKKTLLRRETFFFFFALALLLCPVIPCVRCLFFSFEKPLPSLESCVQKVKRQLEKKKSPEPKKMRREKRRAYRNQKKIYEKERKSVNYLRDVEKGECYGKSGEHSNFLDVSLAKNRKSLFLREKCKKKNLKAS